MSTPLRILYAATIRLPTEKAHGAQIMRTSEALAQQGAQVELVVPGRKTRIKGDVFDYYSVERNFSVTQLRVADWVGWGRVGFLLTVVLFARRVARHARAQKPDAIYSRDRAIVLALSITSAKLVWEVHGQEPSWLVRRLSSRVQVVAISAGIKDELVRQGMPAGRVLVAHDGIDLQSFADAPSKDEARRRLKLPPGKKIAMYIGRLDGWKGTDTLFKASVVLPKDVQVVVIGGEQGQVEALRVAYPHVLFLGFLPYRDIANNEAAADVVVLPNTARDMTSRKYTSPLKLFSYMASGVPMVVSDLPSLREVVSEKEAFFFKPDSAESLTSSIVEALAAPDALVRAGCAKQMVAEYTWDKRAGRIIHFIS